MQRRAYRRRFLRIVTVAVAVVLITLAGNRLYKPTVYQYQGKGIDKWFEEYLKARVENKSEGAVHRAFYAMGTNAVPFLSGRISRDISESLGERCIGLLPASMRPTTRFQEALAAHDMLIALRPPLDMIKPLLAPALIKKGPGEYRLARSVLLALRDDTDEAP